MQIEIKVTLSADAALLAALTALAGAKAQPSVQETKTKSTKAPAVEKSQAIVAAVEASPSESSAPESSNGSTHTLESLRALAVPKSKAGKKDAIRAKLTELGYPDGLNGLQPKDFDAFHAYIVSL